MTIEQAFNGLIEAIVRVLPHSPFQAFISEFSELPFLGYLNWFIPVRSMLLVMAAWLIAVAAFYLYSVIARWVKLIGD